MVIDEVPNGLTHVWEAMAGTDDGKGDSENLEIHFAEDSCASWVRETGELNESRQMVDRWPRQPTSTLHLYMPPRSREAPSATFSQTKRATNLSRLCRA